MMHSLNNSVVPNLYDQRVFVLAFLVVLIIIISFFLSQKINQYFCKTD